MRLIDADKLHYKRVLLNDCTQSAVVVFAKEIDKAKKIKAIPIEWIEGQIKMYDELSDIKDDRWGDIYHTFAQLLRGTIAHWRKDNEID